MTEPCDLPATVARRLIVEARIPIIGRAADARRRGIHRTGARVVLAVAKVELIVRSIVDDIVRREGRPELVAALTGALDRMTQRTGPFDRFPWPQPRTILGVVGVRDCPLRTGALVPERLSSPVSCL